MDKHSYSYLKMCIKNIDTWCGKHDWVFRVGEIMKDERVIDTIDMAFDYFEYPWHYEPEMKDLIKEYELELVSEEFFNLPISDRELALEWMSSFDIVSKDAYDLLLDDIEDTI